MSRNPDPDRSGSRTDPRADPKPNSGLKKFIYLIFFIPIPDPQDFEPKIPNPIPNSKSHPATSLMRASNDVASTADFMLNFNILKYGGLDN